MKRSGIRAVMELALADPEAIRLEVGEPDANTPAHVIDAAAGDAHAGHTGYTSSSGAADLRTALAEKISRVNDLPTTADRVVVTHGAMNAITIALQGLLGPGDELLLPDPEFPNWRMAAMVAGAEVGTYPARHEDGFVPRLADIAAAITPATRVILVNSPNNPTGAVYPPELLEQIVALARRYDLWVISDECYESITFDVEHVSPAPVRHRRPGAHGVLVLQDARDDRLAARLPGHTDCGAGRAARAGRRGDDRLPVGGQPTSRPGGSARTAGPRGPRRGVLPSSAGTTRSRRSRRPVCGARGRTAPST